MKDLSDLVTPHYATKWKVIGPLLGLASGTLDIIDSDYSNSEARCNEMWQRWLDAENNATWGKVSTAIDAAMRHDNVPLPPAMVDIVKATCIKERSEISEDDWPPYQPETYTTVALIHHKEKIALEEAVFAIAKKAYKGKVTSPGSTSNDSNGKLKSLSGSTKDSYLSSCKYIKNVSDIFPVDSASQSYTVLIEGAPGIGKTILTKEIAFLWANGTILEDTKLLVSIYLRDPSVHKISNCTDFAQYITSTSPQNMMIQGFTNYLFNTCGTGIMFVFDGYDELPESLRQESFIANIINRKMFPCSKIAITSRPSASARLHKKVECRIEILGFTDDDRRIYISRALNNDLEKVEKTFAYLEDNPVINSLCYIPLNMAIFICLLRSSAQNELPTTQTEINNRFICMTISRYFLREEKEKLNILSLFDMPAEHMGKLKELSKLAFDLLGNDKIVFNYTDIKVKSQLFSKNLNGLGLLKAVKHISFTDNREQVSFNFLHFSLQEFLAAFHVASSPNTEQHRIMNENFWNDRYLNMWIMYFGLTKGNSRPLLHFLSGSRFNWLAKFKFRAKDAIDESIIEDKIKCLHLFQCFLEAGNETMCQQVGHFLNDFIIDLSGQVITSGAMQTLGFFLTRSAHKEWEVLNLSNCYINNKYVKILSKSCLSDQSKNLSIKILDISSNNITSSALHEICKLVLCLQVQQLIICNNDLSEEDISIVLLNVVINDDSCNFCVSLTVVSSQGSTHTKFEDTKSVYVINCKCNQILKHLNYEGDFCHPQHLLLWDSTLNIDDVRMLARNNANLQISIVNTNLDDDELDYLQSEFQEFLESNLSLVKENAINYIMKSENRLVIFGANIQHSILIFKNTLPILSLLQVTNCHLTPLALHCIGAIISRNRTSWEIIDLSDCSIDDEGFAVLCSYFPGDASDYINVEVSIKVFNISGNCLSSLSVPTIMNSLKHCIVNQYILSHNNIPQQELSDAVIAQLHTQFASANFLQKHPLIIVNDAKQLSTQLKLTNKDICNVYIINCEIDASDFEIVLQKQWTINELILANNDFYKDTLHIFQLLLYILPILKLKIFQAGVSDEVASESVTKLKKVTEVEYTLLSQTKLMCYLTYDKQIDKIISHIASNAINDLPRTDCRIAHNEVLDTNNILWKAVEKNYNVVTLEITRYKISDGELCQLGFIMCSKYVYLKKIAFSQCQISDMSYKKLSNSLFNDRSVISYLKKLDISHNNLTSSCVSTIVASLKSCIIEKLNISNNILDDELCNAMFTEAFCERNYILNFIAGVPLIILNNAKAYDDEILTESSNCTVFLIDAILNESILNKITNVMDHNISNYSLCSKNNVLLCTVNDILSAFKTLLDDDVRRFSFFAIDLIDEMVFKIANYLNTFSTKNVQYALLSSKLLTNMPSCELVSKLVYKTTSYHAFHGAEMCQVFCNLYSHNDSLLNYVRELDLTYLQYKSSTIPELVNSLQYCCVEKLTISVDDDLDSFTYALLCTYHKQGIYNFVLGIPLTVINNNQGEYVASSSNIYFSNNAKFDVVENIMTSAVSQTIIFIDPFITGNQPLEKLHDILFVVITSSVISVIIYQTGHRLQDKVALEIVRQLKILQVREKVQYVLVSDRMFLGYKAGKIALKKESLVFISIFEWEQCDMEYSEIALALSRNHGNLKEIKLSRSFISDTSFKQFTSEVFSCNTMVSYLKLLDLSHNYITPSCITAIIASLQSCIIEKINISDNNNISEELNIALFNAANFGGDDILNFRAGVPLIIINSVLAIDNSLTGMNRFTSFLMNCKIDENIISLITNTCSYKAFDYNIFLLNNNILLKDLALLLSLYGYLLQQVASCTMYGTCLTDWVVDQIGNFLTNRTNVKFYLSSDTKLLSNMSTTLPISRWLAAHALQELNLTGFFVEFPYLVQFACGLRYNIHLKKVKFPDSDDNFLPERSFIIDVILSVNHSLTELIVYGKNLWPRDTGNFQCLTEHFSFHHFQLFKNNPTATSEPKFKENFITNVDKNLHAVTVKEMCPFQNSTVFTHYVDYNGGVYYYKDHDVALFIPPNSISEGYHVEIKVSSSLFGPFELPDNYNPISSFVWIGADYQFKHPVYLVMSHFAHIDNLKTIKHISMFEACKLQNSGCGIMKKVENCFIDTDLNYCVYSTDHFCSFCLGHEGSINSMEYVAMYYNYSDEIFKAVKYSADFRFCHQNVHCIQVI